VRLAPLAGGCIVVSMAGLLACRGLTPPAAHIDKPNIVLVDIDSLRGDHLSPAACEAGHFPVTCARAADATWFTGTTSSSGWTLPALDALLTGRHPSAASLVVARPDQLQRSEGEAAVLVDAGRGDDTPPALARVLGMYGYDTQVFWGNTTGAIAPFLSAGFGQVHTLEVEPDDAIAWHDDVEGWLAAGPQEPFFAMVHTMDAHSGLPVEKLELPPTDLPPELARRLLAMDMSTIHAQLSDETPGPVALHSLAQAYASRLRWHDAQVGWLFDQLEAQGLLERTVVIITSNHGEGLSGRLPGAHGPPYGETLHVPLIWLEPEGGEEGAVVDTPAQLIDIAPTLLARVGATLPAGLDGRALTEAPGVQAEPYEPRPAYAISSWRSVALRDGEWAAVRTQSPHEADPHLQLFRSGDDPRELQDLAVQHPAQAQAMDALLDAWIAELRQRAATQPQPQDDPTLSRELQERGYWGDFDVVSPSEPAP
jgi:arylsulfatase A-like enzyme